MEISETLAYILTFVFGVVFFIIIQNAVLTVDTSAWAFTGHDFLISMLPVIPWLFLIGCLIVPVYIIMKVGSR